MMPRRLKPCGTEAAYRRHLYRRETPCIDCCAAYAAAERVRHHRRTRAAVSA